jgi:hypothetical protein
LGYEGELEQASTLFRGRVDPVELVAEIEYTRILGVPNATVTVTVQDPQGLARAVDPMTAFVSTGPVSGFDLGDYSPATEIAPEVYEFTVPLSEKHVSVCALAFYWVDPADNTENITQRILWLDVNDDANIVDVIVTYSLTAATVQVKGDADTVSLHAEEFRGGVWTSVLDPTPAFNGPDGDRFSTDRRGAFSVDLDATERLLRVFGKNAGGDDGPREDVTIQALVPVTPPGPFRVTELLRDAPGGSPPFDPEEFSILVFFVAESEVDMVEYEYTFGSTLYSVQVPRASWSAQGGNTFSVVLEDNSSNVFNWNQTDETPISLAVRAFDSTSALLVEEIRVFRPADFASGVSLTDGVNTTVTSTFAVGTGLALDLSGTPTITSGIDISDGVNSDNTASLVIGSGLTLDLTGTPTISADAVPTTVSAGYGIFVSEPTPGDFEVEVDDFIADVTVDSAAPSSPPTRGGSIWFVV